MTYTPPSIPRCECKGPDRPDAKRTALEHVPTPAERRAHHWGATVTLYRDVCFECGGVR